MEVSGEVQVASTSLKSRSSAIFSRAFLLTEERPLILLLAFSLFNELLHLLFRIKVVCPITWESADNCAGFRKLQGNVRVEGKLTPILPLVQVPPYRLLGNRPEHELLHLRGITGQPPRLQKCKPGRHAFSWGSGMRGLWLCSALLSTFDNESTVEKVPWSSTLLLNKVQAVRRPSLGELTVAQLQGWARNCPK